MEGKVTLGYWRVRGIAERIRMLMEYLGVAYDEAKYDGKESGKWFAEKKPELIKINPAINLPYLIDGEKVIAESDAIIVHLIHKAGRLELLGRNADEQVQIATAYGVTRDLHANYVKLVYGMYGDGTFEEAKKEYIEKFKPYLGKLSGLLGEKEFYAGEITWVDFVLGKFMQVLWLFEAPLIESYPNIWNHQKRIWDLPAIKAYHETDRYAERPCNGGQHQMGMSIVIYLQYFPQIRYSLSKSYRLHIGNLRRFHCP